MPRFRGGIDLVYGGAQHIAAQPHPRTATDVARVSAQLQQACREHLAFAMQLVG